MTDGQRYFEYKSYKRETTNKHFHTFASYYNSNKYYFSLKEQKKIEKHIKKLEDILNG